MVIFLQEGYARFMESSERIEKMKAYYKRCAPWHDELMSYEGNVSMERLLGPIIDLFSPLVTGKSVLEIGCGTGNWSEVLARRALAVTAIDSSAQSLKLAREKVCTYENLRFEQGDAYDLGETGEVYDTAFAADFYSHIPKSRIQQFLSGVCQKLKPDGWIIMLDMTEREMLQSYFAGYDNEGNRLERRELPDGSVFEIIKNFPTEEDLRNDTHKLCSEFQYHLFSELERWMMFLRI